MLLASKEVDTEPGTIVQSLALLTWIWFLVPEVKARPVPEGVVLACSNSCAAYKNCFAMLF